jgi:hypothetical protein
MKVVKHLDGFLALSLFLCILFAAHLYRENERIQQRNDNLLYRLDHLERSYNQLVKNLY